jgi:putative cell wall-binding protein
MPFFVGSIEVKGHPVMLRATATVTRHPRTMRAVGRVVLAVGAVGAMAIAAVPAAAAAPVTAVSAAAATTAIAPPEVSLDCSVDPSRIIVSDDSWPQAEGFGEYLDRTDDGVVTVGYGIVNGTTLNGKQVVLAHTAGWVFGEESDVEIALRVLSCDDPTGAHTEGMVGGSWPALPDGASRISGANRYETAAKIATAFGTAGAVVIANGTTAKAGVDALAANYLAGRVGAPILLTQAASTDAATLGALKTVLNGAADPTLYVMGAADSVSDAVVAQFKAAAASVATGTVTVKRIAGANRYATAALAATTAGAAKNSLALADGGTGATTALVVSGEVNADALAGGPLSYAWGVPVLLTPSTGLPAAATDAIKSLGITQLIVLGGADRVPQAVLDQAATAGVTSVKRIAGANRYDTAAQLYGFAVDTLADGAGSHYAASGTTAYLANGTTGFPDALAAGPLAGKNGGVLLTVPGMSTGASPRSFMAAHSQFNTVVALGSGSDAVSNYAVAEAATAAAG